MGRFYQLVLAMLKVAEKEGVIFHFNQNIEKINIKDNQATSLVSNGKTYFFDTIISSVDYHRTETLLPEKYKNYNEKYWEERTFAPSCLIYYLGIKKKIQT